MNQITKVVASYECIASEYYDLDLHPTCANFAELSGRFLARRIKTYLDISKEVLEVGVGRSILAAELAKLEVPLAKLTLLDQSIGMLEHSRTWEKKGAKLVVADARAMDLPNQCFQLIVCSLGDPYNVPQFWSEMRRVLSRGGICLFTIPTPEWASRFRRGQDRTLAEFVLKNGARAFVPSIIPPDSEQSDMISAAGLEIEEVCDFGANYLTAPVSTKLQLGTMAPDLPIVRGYVIRCS